MALRACTAVTAAPDAWSALEPKIVDTIEHLFGYYGDDAGWSPESLRAIGVEPLPTPEPPRPLLPPHPP